MFWGEVGLGVWGLRRAGEGAQNGGKGQTVQPWDGVQELGENVFGGVAVAKRGLGCAGADWREHWGGLEVGQLVCQKCGGTVFPGPQTAAESTQVPGLSELLFQSHQDQSEFISNYVIDDITSWKQHVIHATRSREPGLLASL